MLTSLLECMCCPVCKSDLLLKTFEKTPLGVREGILVCKHCNIVYPISNFIPRMVPTSLYDSVTFCNTHSIKAEALLHNWPDCPQDISSIQSQTQNNFGHEWEHYASLGWTSSTGEDASDLQESMMWFKDKLLLDSSDIAGKLLLDAGCGNGRFSYAAFELGANVVSMDLTRAADVAQNNIFQTKNIPQVVQGDILHLPFKTGVFDIIFTLGVIQHTGKALQAVRTLADALKKEGLLSVRTYRRGNQRLEDNDAAIRAVTTQFSLQELHEFSDLLHGLTRFIMKKGLFGAVARHINIFPKRYDIFDWYAAPVAEKLTYREMRDTFASIGLTTFRDSDDDTTPEDRTFGAISIVGQKTS